MDRTIVRNTPNLLIKIQRKLNLEKNLIRNVKLMCRLLKLFLSFLFVICNAYILMNGEVVKSNGEFRKL